MKRYFNERVRSLFRLDDPPHRLALAFAVGVFIAFSPWLGLHIASAFALAWMFRLNKVVVLTGSFVNNPWTISAHVRLLSLARDQDHGRQRSDAGHRLGGHRLPRPHHGPQAMIVPSYLLTPISVDINNYQKELVDTGYIKAEDLK